MIITQDWELIRSIIERPDCIDGFGGKPLGDDILKSRDRMYFYDDTTGLFPINIMGKTLIMHAAIPKENRGIKAIRAAKELAKKLIGAGFDVVTHNTKANQAAFVRLVGFTKIGERNGINYWRYKGAT